MCDVSTLCSVLLEYPLFLYDIDSVCHSVMYKYIYIIISQNTTHFYAQMYNISHN